MEPHLRTIIFVCVMTVVVILGSRFGFTNRKLPVGLRELVATGSLFIVLGVLIGPRVSGLLDKSIMEQLKPVIIIALGWIGFLYGSHLEWRRLRRIQRGLFAVGIFESLLTLFIVGIGVWFLIPFFSDEMPGLCYRLMASAICGACAAGTLPAGIFLLASEGKLSGRNLRTLKTLSVLDDIPAIFVVGLMCAFLRIRTFEHAWWLGFFWVLVSIGMGVVLGIVTHWLFPKKGDVRENSLVLLAMVAVGAGSAAMMDLSPIFVCAISGFFFANLSPRKESAFGLLSQREHTLYAVFLMFAGALFDFDLRLLYVMVPAFMILRAASKIGGTYLGMKLFHRESSASPFVGTGLLFHGGMALAIVVGFERQCGQELVLFRQVVTTIVLSVMLNELIAPFLSVRFLGKGGSRP